MATSRRVINPYHNQRRRDAPNAGEVDGNGSPKSGSGRTITPQSNGRNKKQTRSSKSSRRKNGRQGSTPPPASAETTQEQFPHRSGRVRKSNKFGASLRKSSMDVTDSLAQIVMGTSTKQTAASRTLENSDSSEDEAEFSDHSYRQVNKKTKLNDKRSNDKNKDYQPSSYRKRSPAIEDDSDDDDS
ncbi:MAG: hypothetical protein SGARI_007322, partial [Bacillariaceae sp.]